MAPTIKFTDNPEVVEIPLDVAAALLGRDLVYYPETDGEPMADSDHQFEAMTDGKAALVHFHRDNPNVYVAANMFIYYEQGDNTKRVAPDIFVIHGVHKHKRSSYKLWREGVLPSIVFEIASPGTWKKDIKNEKLYGKLKIPEYIMLDPFAGEHFGAPLLGFYHTGSKQRPSGYEPMPYLTEKPDPSWHSGVYSRTLELEIWAKVETVDDEKVALFRFRDPKTGCWLLSPQETDEALTSAEQRVVEEAVARRQAEEKMAKEAISRRQAENRAAEAEAELARLKMELARFRGQNSNE